MNKLPTFLYWGSSSPVPWTWFHPLAEDHSIRAPSFQEYVSVCKLDRRLLKITLLNTPVPSLHPRDSMFRNRELLTATSFWHDLIRRQLSTGVEIRAFVKLKRNGRCCVGILQCVWHTSGKLFKSKLYDALKTQWASQHDAKDDKIPGLLFHLSNMTATTLAIAHYKATIGTLRCAFSYNNKLLNSFLYYSYIQFLYSNNFRKVFFLSWFDWLLIRS